MFSGDIMDRVDFALFESFLVTYDCYCTISYLSSLRSLLTTGFLAVFFYSALPWREGYS